uniref:Putative secreted protein n=1 Tax=Anopheles darlingi TaxID=43151 RepID=A0A2M4DEB5_ANODA
MKPVLMLLWIVWSICSRHVIIAIPATRLRLMLCAARRIRPSSGSSAKSFRTICSQVLDEILTLRSTIGVIHSEIVRSSAAFTICFRCGCVCRRATFGEKVTCGAMPARLVMLMSA